ncbi:DUF5300 family protein [Blautia sp. MSJ-19]|uniref:DUF5300 family protein n=1 Tax=Blautia sp. MSJ-19 TaxID=2841517 RepID=UPI001C0F10FF|nr:DUF5300 family protein [Blautia sp. MSJ-19]MBU5480163.1 DUF5300 family protein [Blautia sp. MSJ-19]
MKKSSKILVLIFAVAFVAFCAVNMQNQKVVEAYNTEASYITIKNSTAFTLENVHVIYNGDKDLEVGDIRTSSSETAEILPDDRRITEVKVTGEIFNGRKFSGTFTGIVNNDTLLKVDMDEDFSLFVTSNIDDFDY